MNESRKMSSNKFTNFDMRMFDKALKIAALSDFKQFKTGCVLTYKKHILAFAPNGEKTSPEQAHYNKFRNFNHVQGKPIHHKIHAEIAALHKVPYPVGLETDWNKVNVYVARISPGRKKGIGLARPCEGCLKALEDIGIRNIFYTTNDGTCAYERIL